MTGDVKRYHPELGFILDKQEFILSYFDIFLNQFEPYEQEKEDDVSLSVKFMRKYRQSNISDGVYF